MVKTRKVLTLCFEVPLEQQADVLTILGAPMPDKEIWCGIARLNETSAPQPDRSVAGKERYLLSDERERAVTRAAMLPNDPQFRQWLRDRRGWKAIHFTVGDAADEIRHLCAINSRRELLTNDKAYEAFLALETEYGIASGKIAEPR